MVSISSMSGSEIAVLVSGSIVIILGVILVFWQMCANIKYGFQRVAECDAEIRKIEREERARERAEQKAIEDAIREDERLRLHAEKAWKAYFANDGEWK